MGEKPAETNIPTRHQPTGMSEQATLFRNPVFRWGMPATTAILILGMAFLFIEDQTLRLLMVAIAGMDLVITPQILKRAAQAD